VTTRARDHAAAATIRVRLPGLVDAYTGGAREIDLPVSGSPTVAQTLAALDARYPGLQFRLVDEQGAIRPHVKLFVEASLVRDLGAVVPRGGELMIVGALSGG
jgi:sulfur-carrier protein